MIERSAEQLQPLCGVYDLPDGGALRVTASGCRLRVEPRGQLAFTRLHSTRAVDLERIKRQVARLDEALRALFERNAGPLHEAYGETIAREHLQRRWDRRLRFLQERRGASRGYEIVGTAQRDDFDYTLVLYRFGQRPFLLP